MKSAQILLVICLMLLLGLEVGLAQQTGTEPPTEPVVTPIHGYLALGTTEGTILLNTFDGTVQPVLGAGAEEVWSPQGDRLATTVREGLAIVGFTITAEGAAVDPQTSAAVQHDLAVRERAYQRIAGWSADGQQIMLFSSTSPDQVTTNTGYRTWYLDIVDVATGSSRRVLEIPGQTPMDSVFFVPPEYEGVTLDSLNTVHWNPRYPDWVFIQPIGYGRSATTGEESGWFDAGMYNYVTGEFISFLTLFPQTVISTTDWHPDGTKIAMTTMTGATVVRFTAEGGNPHLELIADSVDTNDQTVLRWLGSGDLIVTGTTVPYRTSFLAEIIRSGWHDQEFIAIESVRPRYTGGYRPFLLTAEEDERRRLSCRFFDEVVPPRLSTNTRGQVTFTDGTPSRLRSEPGTQPQAAVVTQMQEGTSFQITGEAYCVDGFRWWPVHLEDGTTGWAAEGTSDEAWLEPVE